VINPEQIQAVVGLANPVRRLFRLSQWQIVAPRPGGQRSRVRQLIPIGRDADIAGLLPAVWRDCVYPDGNWVRVDPYHRRRLWSLCLVSVLIFLGGITAIDAFANTLASASYEGRFSIEL
jgi:hypothetical protein